MANQIYTHDEAMLIVEILKTLSVDMISRFQVQRTMNEISKTVQDYMVVHIANCLMRLSRN